MKKSEAYHLAQVAVITTSAIAPENKIEVLKVLIEKEDVELFYEKQEAEKNG